MSETKQPTPEAMRAAKRLPMTCLTDTDVAAIIDAEFATVRARADAAGELLNSLKWAIERISMIEERGRGDKHAYCGPECCYKTAYAAIAKAEGRDPADPAPHSAPAPARTPEAEETDAAAKNRF